MRGSPIFNAREPGPQKKHRRKTTDKLANDELEPGKDVIRNRRTAKQAVCGRNTGGCTVVVVVVVVVVDINSLSISIEKRSKKNRNEKIKMKMKK